MVTAGETQATVRSQDSSLMSDSRISDIMDRRKDQFAKTHKRKINVFFKLAAGIAKYWYFD